MKEKILKLRQEGKSYNEIRRILGCSKGTISYHCSKIDNDRIKSINLDIKNKLQIKDRSFLLPSEDIISSIIELRKNRKKYLEISKELGISINIIKKVCRKSGLSKYRKFSNMSDEMIYKIRSIYNEVKSATKTGILLGISRHTVRKYIDIKEKNKLNEDELKRNKVKNVVDWRKRTKMKLVEYRGGLIS